MEKLGKLFKKIRSENSLTQEEMAKSLGYKSKATINKIEKGINDITFSKLIQFTEKYNVDITRLIKMNKLKIKIDINRIFVSFSGRKNGISDFIVNNFKQEVDEVCYYRNLNIHDCSFCQYECFYKKCPYEDDDNFSFFETLNKSKEIVFIIPMYCSNAPSLFYKFSERSQAYFNKNEENYKNIKSKTKVILIFGSNDEYPSFSKNFNDFVENESKIFLLERHKLNIKRDADKITDIALLNKISKFLD